jgi:hypothetical protein
VLVLPGRGHNTLLFDPDSIAHVVERVKKQQRQAKQAQQASQARPAWPDQQARRK